MEVLALGTTDRTWLAFWELVAVAARCSRNPLPGCSLGLCVAYLKSHPLFSCCNTDGTESLVKAEKSVLSCFFAWPLTASIVASMQEKVAGEGRGMLEWVAQHGLQEQISAFV